MSTEATDREAAVALAEALGNLPLALEQAAAYAGQTGLSLADYLSLFRERAAAYVPPASPSADYPDALAVTFEIAFARLREESPAAADLLMLCAFLAPDEVPLEIFKEVSAKEEAEEEAAEEEAAASVQLPEALASVAANPEALTAAAATLQTYAFAKVRGGSFLSMHRLTQAIARDRLGDDERKLLAESGVTLMRASFSFDSEDTRTWPPSARLLQHALTVAEHARALGIAGKQNMILLNKVGKYLYTNAELAEAKAAFIKSTELCEQLFGSTHPRLGALLNNIGETLRRQGLLDEATEYLKRALAIDEVALGLDHPNVAIGLNNLGNVLSERGAHAEAREHLERALAIFESGGDPTRAYVAITLNNIGLILSAQDNLKVARAYYERALQIYEEVYGHDHPQVAIALNNLGDALIKLGDVVAARQYLERGMRIFQAHLGEKHPWTLIVKRNLEQLDEHDADSPSFG
jgi:tetratricopeptide (TPR) repeat protein